MASNKVITALVVDDDRILRLLHRKQLIKLGVSSREVKNGKEAVDLCRSGEVFDIIFMDYDMPILNGPQVTRLLREMKVPSKIVGITAQSREEEIREFMEAGLDEYLEKSLTQANILSILQGINNNNTPLAKCSSSSSSSSNPV